jgi:predicted nucleic acid-binding protein
VGLTVLDAGVLIGVLDASDAHHGAARRALAAARERGDRLVVPASAYAEILVGPAAAGPQQVQTVDEFLARLPATVEAITPDMARRAAHLRARHRRLRLPDALVIATAEALGADVLLTTDHEWPARSALGVGCRIDKIGPR